MDTTKKPVTLKILRLQSHFNPLFLDTSYWICKGNLDPVENCKITGRLRDNEFTRTSNHKNTVHTHHNHEDHFVFLKSLNTMKENAAKGVETFGKIMVDSMEK